MTHVAKLIQPISPPFCEAKVDRSFSPRRINREDDACSRHAKYDIGGHMYCEVHAGRVALYLLLQENSNDTQS